MGSPAKFLFDVDFGRGVEAKPSITLADHASKVAEAETVAYRNGFMAAENEAKADLARRGAAALERIGEALSGMREGLEAVEERLESEAVQVATAVAKKLAPDLLAREPFAEIAALVTECLRHLVAAPHLVVRVNDALHETAQRELQGIVRARGFDGRLVVLAEPTIAVGDCRIEWADGGITRDRAAVQRVIDEAVARYIAGRQSNIVPPGIAL